MQALEDATPLIGGNLPIPKNVKCFGTKEGSRVWFNTSDYVGLFFAAIVWGLLLFAFVTMLQMYETIHDKGLGQDKTRVLSSTNFYVLCTFFVLACWSFFATMLGDPGSVPWNAHPLEVDKTNGNKLSICGHCDSYKPPFAHHDRVSGRCVSRMDHFW